MALTISACNLYNKSSVEPCLNDKIYTLLDTSAFYQLNKIYYDSNTAYKDKEISIHKNGLKFYGNGRVAFFFNVEIDNPAALNPNNARKGIYCFKEGNNVIEFSNRHVQSGTFFTKESVKLFKDSLITYLPKNAKGGGYHLLYLKKEIPMRNLKYTPNW